LSKQDRQNSFSQKMQQFNHTKSEEQKATDWEGNDAGGDNLDCYMISGLTYCKYIKRFKFNKGVHKIFDCNELEKAPQKFISWKKYETFIFCMDAFFLHTRML